MSEMRRMGAAIIAIGAVSASLCACASAETTPAPAWFEQSAAASAPGYPSLSDAPRTTSTTNDPAHWDAVQADLFAAREAMQANPRNEPATADSAQGFLDQAREDIEQTRDAH